MDPILRFEVDLYSFFTDFFDLLDFLDLLDWMDFTELRRELFFSFYFYLDAQIGLASGAIDFFIK